jgi:hypothetical protein
VDTTEERIIRDTAELEAVLNRLRRVRSRKQEGLLLCRAGWLLTSIGVQKLDGKPLPQFPERRLRLR